MCSFHIHPLKCGLITIFFNAISLLTFSPYLYFLLPNANTPSLPL